MLLLANRYEKTASDKGSRRDLADLHRDSVRD